MICHASPASDGEDGSVSRRKRIDIGHSAPVSFLTNTLIRMVARGGIEPPTRGFSGDSRGLLSNHLQRLPAPSPASPRHNYGTPNLSSSHSRHSGVCGLIPFSAPNNQRDQTIKLGNEDIFANASLRAQLCRHLGHSKPQAMLWMRLAGGRLARRRWPSSGSQVGGCEPRSGSRKIRFGYPAS